MPLPVWLASVFGGAIGKALGKGIEWLPGKKESLRNRIENTKRKLHEIQTKVPFTDRDSRNYQRLASKLRKLEQQARNL